MKNIDQILLNNLDCHLQILKNDKLIILEKVKKLSKQIIKCINSGGKILVFGNGGSASDAQHFSTELTVRLKKNRKALPCISLSTDTSALTAIGNDFSFKLIFKRQLEALARTKDIIIPITTSGNSLNILEAIRFSKKNKNYIFGMLGNNGGKSKKYCNDFYSVSSNDPSRVQEVHIIFWHTVCEIVENYYSN